MKRALIIIATLAVCGSLAAPALAADTGWHVRVFAAGFDPDLDVVVPAENPDEVRIRGESDLGFGASLEYRFNGVFGLELGAFGVDPGISLSAELPGAGRLSLTDAMTTTVIPLDLNFHLTPDSESFDVYLGAGIVSLGYGNLHYVDPEGDALDVAVSDDLGYSAKAGLEIALGKNSSWAAVGGLRYIWSDLEFTQVDAPGGTTPTLDLEVFSFSVGVGYSF